MSQPPQPPPPGTVVNDHLWDGRQWVPLPQVGQVVNGHWWDGRQWVPLQPQPVQPQPASGPASGQASPAHRWILSELGRLARAWQFEWRQQGDQVTLSKMVAEQRSFMATGRLTYEARVRVDDERGEVRFSERLKESRSGMGGGDDDFGPSGHGVQRTSYNSARDTVQDTIEEQAARYRTKYPIDFRYDAVGPQVRGIAEAAGYTFAHGGPGPAAGPD